MEWAVGKHRKQRRLHLAGRIEWPFTSLHHFRVLNGGGRRPKTFEKLINDRTSSSLRSRCSLSQRNHLKLRSISFLHLRRVFLLFFASLSPSLPRSLSKAVDGNISFRLRDLEGRWSGGPSSSLHDPAANRSRSSHISGN